VNPIVAAALKAGQYTYYGNSDNATEYWRGGARAAVAVLRSITAAAEAEELDLAPLDELVDVAANALIFGNHTLGLDFDLCEEYWAIMALLRCRPWGRYYVVTN